MVVQRGGVTGSVHGVESSAAAVEGAVVVAATVLTAIVASARVNRRNRECVMVVVVRARFVIEP